MLCCALLHFGDTVFFQIEGLWQPCVKQVCPCHLPNSICLLCVSVPHFGNSCHYFKPFHIIILVVVISDAIIVNTLGNHDPCLCKTVNLINVCVLTAPPTSYSSIFFLFPHSPYFLIHKNTESRSTNNPTLASKHSRERKSCTFFFQFQAKATNG